MLNWTSAEWANWHARHPDWIRGNPVEGNPFYSKAEIAAAKEKETMDYLPTRFDWIVEEPKTNPGVSSGWEGRSDYSAFKRYIVFEVGGIAEAAAFRAWALGPDALDGKFKSLQGSWKGRHQPSFICEDTNSNRAMLKPWLAGQEAILCLGPAYRDGKLWGNREAILDWLRPDGYTVERREPMAGKWQWVSKATALRQDGWTFDPLDCHYYSVV